MRHTYNLGFTARTQANRRVILPDAVATDQRSWDGRTFMARRLDGRGRWVRVRLRGDLYGLHTPGTGDPVVTAV